MARKSKIVPICPDPLDASFLRHSCRLGKALANAEWRPEPTKALVQRWDDFIKQWARNKRRPLFVRRRTAGRGKVINHNSGRILIPVDNATAQWVYRAVLENREPPTKVYLRSVPIALAMGRSEREDADFDLILGQTERLSYEGWKLCHIESVKLGPGKPHEIPIDRLQEHFLRFLSPSNMFVAPKSRPAVGELPEVIQEIKNFRE